MTLMTHDDLHHQARAHMKALQAQKVAEQVVRTMLEEAQEELEELRKEVRHPQATWTHGLAIRRRP